MTTYYVRPDGSNSNAGTGPGTGQAWQTIGKALGATGIASGDTVYIAPGTYRETVTVAMTSAAAETFVIGDVSASQFTDLQGGPVRFTAYTTNDTTNPSASVLLNLTSKDWLTFVDIWFQASGTSPGFTIATSENLTFRRCLFTTGDRSQTFFNINVAVDTAANILVENCIVHGHSSNFVSATFPTSTTADYDGNIVVQNCTILWSSGTAFNVSASGANSFKGGGVKVYNCHVEAATCFNINSANIATSAGNQCELYNSIVFCASGLLANTLGQLVENYNLIYASTTHSNVTQGANTVASSGDFTHALMQDYGQSVLWGMQPRAFVEPTSGSPQLGRGSDAGVSLSTDLFGRPRPSGGASASKAWGPLERGNTFGKETGTVRTGTTAMSITGPGVQDFQLPVDDTATTVSVWVRWDSTYTGTKPIMKVLNGEEVGVADDDDTATGSADAWEQLTLSFTPTAVGIVTIRFQSSDTNGAGEMYVDDFSVA